MRDTRGPWRKPAEETVDLFPGLVVHDGRVTGSITIGRSRLPLWAIIGEYCTNGWDGVLAGWDYIESDYGFTNADLANLLYWLLEARGDFGRLILAIANAERLESARRADESDRHFSDAHPGGHVCECGLPLPPPWWADPDLRAPVVEALRACLDALTPANDNEDTSD